MLTLDQAKEIMGKNFIGPAEYKKISDRLPLLLPKKIPPIPFSKKFLVERRDNYILILATDVFLNGEKVSLVRLRSIFQSDPSISEPCFYNQDWYNSEKFANAVSPKRKWYLISKGLAPESRGKTPNGGGRVAKNTALPSAVVLALVFFADYLINNECLWRHDYIWCSDCDHAGDRIYVGRYADPAKINNNGFSVHRHLTINRKYGCVKNY